MSRFPAVNRQGGQKNRTQNPCLPILQARGLLKYFKNGRQVKSIRFIHPASAQKLDLSSKGKKRRNLDSYSLVADTNISPLLSSDSSQNRRSDPGLGCQIAQDA